MSESRDNTILTLPSILLKLADKPESGFYHVKVNVVTDNFDILSENVRNGLPKLADNPETHSQIESIGVDKLPTNVRKKLGRL